MNTDNFTKITEWKHVPFSNAFMFRLVMENPELCKTFLELVLDMKIAKLSHVDPEKSLEAKLSSKGVRLDLYIKDMNGVTYNLEMQASDVDKDALAKRTRYYQSMIDANALKKNAIYSTLPQSIIVFVCKFDPFGLNLGRYTFSNFCHENKELKLPDGSNKIFINTLGQNESLSKELINLMEYINTGAVKDNFTEQLNNRVKVLRDDAVSEQMYIMWQQHDLEEQAKAERKTIANAIYRMLQRGYSDEEIVEIFPDFDKAKLAKMRKESV